MPGLGSQLQNIGTALAGFSAGLQGNLPQFQAAQNQKIQLEQQQAALQQEQMRAMAAERQKTMFSDAAAALQLTKMGNLDGVVQLGLNRLQGLQQLSQQDPSIDPSDTQRVTQLAIACRNGDEEACELMTAELESTVQVGQAIGVLPSPEQEEYTLSPGQQRFRDGEMIASVPADETAKFEVLTPAQAEELGLPAEGRFKRNKETGEVSTIGGAQTVVNVAPASEGERTAGILANRLDFAQSQINEILAGSPEAQAPGALPTVLNAVGLSYLARVSNPAERQIIEAAQDDMLDAALTLGTGAAYTREQFAAYKRSYFPQLGDDPETIEAKAKRLSNLLDAAYEKAGRAAPSTRRSDSSSTGGLPVVSSQADFDALPAGAEFIEDGARYRKP